MLDYRRVLDISWHVNEMRWCHLSGCKKKLCCLMMPLSRLLRSILNGDSHPRCYELLQAPPCGGEVANWQLGQHGTTKASRMAVKTCWNHQASDHLFYLWQWLKVWEHYFHGGFSRQTVRFARSLFTSVCISWLICNIMLYPIFWPYVSWSKLGYGYGSKLGTP